MSDPSSERPRLGDPDEKVAGLLATLGVRDTSDIALGKTITPGTFARASTPVGSATVGASSFGGVQSVGPLPRIGVGGEAKRSEASAPPDFELVRLLGEGGMGRVHLAHQRSLGREVAIKSLKEEVQTTRAADMLRGEATVMGRLEHPNVVPVHAVGLDERGQLVLVMKRIDGVSWTELLRDAAHPRWSALVEGSRSQLDVHLDVLSAVARALQFAHERGVIHRDVKPDNVLVGPHGDVYLADWGVALRQSDQKTDHELVGTPAYMSPEMVEGDPQKIDARTDVYLLGGALHEVLTGKPPHEGRTLQQMLIAAYESVPKTYGDDVPAELAHIAQRAMRAAAAERYPTALAFRRALEDVRQHRVSIALAREGSRRLDGLDGLKADDPALDRSLTEARFAFAQALRDWPENDEAKQGLARCLRRTIEHELGRENAGAARALYAELAASDPVLEERIATLEKALEQRRAEAERLRSLVADQDLRVGQRARNIGVVGLILLASTISILVLSQGRIDASAVGGTELIAISTVLCLACFGAIAVFRKRLLANAINRRIAGLAMFSSLALLMHRGLGVLWEVPADAILAMDLTILTTIPLAGGAIVPRLAWAAPIPILGAVAAWMYPGAISLVFSMTGLFVTVALGLLLIGAQRDQTH